MKVLRPRASEAMSESGSDTLCDCLSVRSPRGLASMPRSHGGVKLGLLQRGVPRARTRGAFRVHHTAVSRFEQFVRSDIFHYLVPRPVFWFMCELRPTCLFGGCSCYTSQCLLDGGLSSFCEVYIALWLIFTPWWQHAANDCEQRELNFRRAFLLSLETMTTIG